MGPPDPQLPPPLSPPPPQPTAKRPSASYAEALRSQKLRKQSHGLPSSYSSSSSKPAKHPPSQANEVRAKPLKATKTGPPQVNKSVPASELPPMPPQLPPHAKFHETTHMKKVPVTRSSYAQALSGKKQPALLHRQQKDNQNHPAAMDTGQTNRSSTSAMDDPKLPKQSKAARKAADGASRQPQPVVPAAPAMEKMHGKHKGKPKGHQHRKPSTEWKRHSSSSVWETLRNETSICTPTKDRGRSFSNPPPVSDPKPLPEADEVSAASEQASEEERNRLRRVEERAQRLATVIEMHDRKELNLWECQYEWDVLLLCNGQEWRVHHDILCRESDWFRERLPPKDCNLSYVRFELKNHAPEQIGSVLHFMYTHNYPNSTYSRDYPLIGEPLRVNVFKYICGASVNCTNMMRFAFDRINEATDILSEYLPQIRPQLRPHPPLDLFTLYDPLGFALAMMYEQGSRQVMLPLRHAMAHFVDNCIMELILNHSFRSAFEVGWVDHIYPNLVNDCIWFAGKGLLGTLPSHVGTLPSPVVTSQRTQDHSIQRQVEERLPPPSRYRNKSRDLDGPWRRGDMRLEPWRHDRAPTICPPRPDERHQPIYLPRPTANCPVRPEVRPQQMCLPQSEDRSQTIRPLRLEDTPPQTAVFRPEDRYQPTGLPQLEDKFQQVGPSRLGGGPARLLLSQPETTQQNSNTDATVIEKPVPNGWGVWPASIWENIEHGGRQYSTDKRKFGDGGRPHNSGMKSTTADHQNSPSNISAPTTEGTDIPQQEKTEDAEKNTRLLSRSGDSQVTVVPLLGGGEANEENFIDLDQADDAKDHGDWAIVDNHHQHEHDGEEIKRPQSVSGDWANPWDIADTWQPPHSGKSLSTRPGEEEDERSTITTFTPVTSTAGDDVMCESIVFEEDDGNEAEKVVAGHDVGHEGDFAMNAPGIMTAVTKQPATNEGGNEVMMSAAAAPNTATATTTAPLT
ncbi:hypothetical protein QBC44DRAFT_148347 [Cladorrhinum sp. PSN332]|nr:hypothetical protein QBC44DRAFT_148347 [Cladorrhinum sp. PSN332]